MIKRLIHTCSLRVITSLSHKVLTYDQTNCIQCLRVFILALSTNHTTVHRFFYSRGVTCQSHCVSIRFDGVRIWCTALASWRTVNTCMRTLGSLRDHGGSIWWSKGPCENLDQPPLSRDFRGGFNRKAPYWMGISMVSGEDFTLDQSIDMGIWVKCVFLSVWFAQWQSGLVWFRSSTPRASVRCLSQNLDLPRQAMVDLPICLVWDGVHGYTVYRFTHMYIYIYTFICV